MMRLLYAARMVFVCSVILLYLVIVGVPVIIFCHLTGTSHTAFRFTQFLDHAVLFLGGIRYRLHGAEKLDPSRGYVFVANHRSFADPAVLLVGLKGELHFLAKKEVFKIPLVGLALSTMGMIEVNRTNREEAGMSVQIAEQKLRQGDWVIFFPEGTRNRTDAPLIPFKKGAFVLAVQAQVPIVPLTVLNTWDVLRPGTMQLRGGHVDVIVHDAISTTGKTYEDRNALLEEARAAIEKGLSAVVPPQRAAVAR